MKPTKQLLRDNLRVVNSHGFCTTGEGRIFIIYQPRGDGRILTIPAWKVVGLKEDTNPKAAWYDYGSMTFPIYHGYNRNENLEAAKLWAAAKYKIREWVRDPFGGWQDKKVYDAVISAIDAARKPRSEYGPCEHCGGPTDGDGECGRCRDFGGTDKRRAG